MNGKQSMRQRMGGRELEAENKRQKMGGIV